MPKQRSASTTSPLSLSVLLWCCLNRHRKFADELLRAHKISFRELAALYALNDEFETVVFTQNNLGNYMGLSDATTMRLVEKLRSRSFLRARANDIFDTRANSLSSTPITIDVLNDYAMTFALLDARLEKELRDYGVQVPMLLKSQKVRPSAYK